MQKTHTVCYPTPPDRCTFERPVANDLIDSHRKHADFAVTFTLSDSRQLSRDTIALIESLQARSKALTAAAREIVELEAENERLREALSSASTLGSGK